jgi:hypothetical protein
MDGEEEKKIRVLAAKRTRVVIRTNTIKSNDFLDDRKGPRSYTILALKVYTEEQESARSTLANGNFFHVIFLFSRFYLVN